MIKAHSAPSSTYSYATKQGRIRTSRSPISHPQKHRDTENTREHTIKAATATTQRQLRRTTPRAPPANHAVRSFSAVRSAEKEMRRGRTQKHIKGDRRREKADLNDTAEECTYLLHSVPHSLPAPQDNRRIRPSGRAQSCARSVSQISNTSTAFTG